MINWGHIGKNDMHEVARKILEHLDRPEVDKMSPAQLSRDLGKPLGNVAYHVKTLWDKGYIVKAGSRPVRGAVEHFYRVSNKLKEEG